jgi:hypothetical protein
MRASHLLLAAVLLAGCGSDGGSNIGYWRGGEPLGSGQPGNGQHPSNANNGGSGGSAGTPTPGGTPSSTSTAPTSTPAPPAPPPAPGSYAVSLDKATDTVDLLAQATFQVSVASSNYQGSVALSATGLPSDVTARFDNATLTLSGTGTVTATLTLETASTSAPGSVPFSVVATGGETHMSASSTLTVASNLTITIPAGVDQNGGTTSSPVMDAFGSYPITITAPTDISSQDPVTIHFYNGDTVPHEIHASSPGAGFPHGSGEFGPGQMEPTQRAINMKGTYDFYLHDQNGPKTVGRIVVQ